MIRLLLALLLAVGSLGAQLIPLGTLDAVGCTPGQNTRRSNGSHAGRNTLQANATSNPTDCTTTFDFSLDGINWFDAAGNQDCSSANVYVTVVDEGTAYVRACLETSFTGTSASTVKAKVETLSENDFATHANWATTGDFDDTGGNCTYTHATGIGTCTQADAGYANALVASQLYTFQYTTSDITGGVISCTVSSGCSAPLALFEASPSSPTTQCTSTATITDDFTITCTSAAAATITFDDLFFYQQNAANESPIHIITAAAHNLTTGDKVTITGVVGNTAANVTANAVTVIDADEFTLDAVAGNAPWVSGGTITTAPDVSFIYLGSQ